MYQVSRTSDLVSLLSQTDLWNRLAGDVPFRETSWLGNWWKHFGDGKEPYAVVARDAAGTICGILPLYVDAGSSRRTLRMIGDGDAFGDYVSILSAPDTARDIAIAMGTFLAESQTGDDHWDLFDVDGVVLDDVGMITMANTLMQHGANVHAQSRMHTWFRPVLGNWDEHLTLFSKTQRRKMRRWSEKVEQTDGLEKQTATSPDQVDAALNAVIELHQRRWNSVGEPGSFAKPIFRAFMEDCVADFFQRDRLYLPTLVYHDQVIAGELHFLGGNQRLYCYSSGYDIDRSELEPGRILVVETLVDLYRHGWSGIDYLRGDEPYKKRMSAEPTRLIRLRIAAPALLPRIKQAAWAAGFEVKQWARRRTGRTPIVVVDLASSMNAGEVVE